MGPIDRAHESFAIWISPVVWYCVRSNTECWYESISRLTCTSTDQDRVAKWRESGKL